MGETVGPRDVRTKLPPVVYVPCGEPVPQKSGHLLIEFREGPDGSVVLPVYTALDRLVKCCGERQPWVVVSVSDLVELEEQAPYDAIVVDADIPVDQRHH